MAITLAGAGNDRVDWGNLPALAGVTGATWLVTFRPTALADGRRLWTQWSGATGNQAWLLETGSSLGGYVALTISNGGGTYHQRFFTGLSNDTIYRVVFTCTFSGTATTMTAWNNGVSQTMNNGFAVNNIAAMISSAASVQLGHETAEGIDGTEGAHGECAIWPFVVPDGIAAALSAGWSPRSYRRTGVLYATLLNTDARNTRNIWVAGGGAGTLTGGANFAHTLGLVSRFMPQAPQTFQVEAGPVEFEFEGSGGLAFGGSAGFAGGGLGHVGSGGMAFGGTDQTERGSYEGSGGMAFGGEADTTAGHITGDGGMAFGGHARGGKGGPGRAVDCGPTIMGEECDT